MNLHTADYDPTLLALAGIPEVEMALPPLCDAAAQCGTVTETAATQTGLCVGTPVCGGMFDIDACAIAMNVVESAALCTIAGTWSINEYVAPAPVPVDTTTRNSLFCLPGQYLIEESSPTSAGNLEWYLKTCLTWEKEQAKAAGENVYAVIDREVEALPPQDSDVIFLPFLYGTNTGCDSAAFMGLSGSHTTAHLLRAVFEGVAFSHRMHIERLLRFREKPVAIRMAGGAANSRVWVQLFADVLNCPIEVVTSKELGTKGCAMAASVAAGCYPNLGAAAAAMVGTVSTVQPRAETACVYDKKYRRYVDVTERLKGVFA